MQINRLFEIVYILLNKGTVTARYLSEEFGVSTRTIYRDVEVLADAGIPLYTERGKNGGICLMKSFTFNKTEMAERERKNIIASVEAIRQTPYVSTQNLLSRLSALLNADEDPWLLVDFELRDDKSRYLFDNLKYAVMDKHPVTFEYYDLGGEKTHEYAEPIQLYCENGKWYLKSYVPEKSEFKAYSVNRIEDISVMEETFEPKKYVSGDDDTPARMVTLKLKISQDNAKRVYDEFAPEQIVRGDDGNFIVTADFPETDWLYGYILSFGEACEVMEPDWIRDTVVARVQNMYNKYYA